MKLIFQIQPCHTIYLEKIKPLIGEKPTLLLIIDNLRFDQWKAIVLSVLYLKLMKKAII